MNYIPLMYRAQIEGRCQIQRIPTERGQRCQAYQWVDEWIEGVAEIIPQFPNDVQTKEYQIAWRFVTNSGQDEGIIRPVIGANGFPYYPGSSMKGAFRRACSLEDKLKYCGSQQETETKPGILRFHGGYPVDLDWIEQELVDVVHPQEDWQVKTNADHSALVQISLYRPTLVFGISCQETLEESEWEKIWLIWTKAIEKGIGLRVSAGYGQPIIHQNNCLLSVHLKGQGLASKLLNNQGEFRPNSFKAALRGHTLRLFGGVTDEVTAETLTKELWGGLSKVNGAIVGQLGISFHASPTHLTIDDFIYTPRQNPVTLPIYQLEQGNLDIIVQSELSESEHNDLKFLINQLLKFSLLIGGFGKSWRRVDHRIFYPSYLRRGDKPMIGCHWEFLGKSRHFYIPVNDLDKLNEITDFLNNLHKFIKAWVESKKAKELTTGCGWREAFYPGKVQVWGRIAENRSDSMAVKWFHQEYQVGKTIKGSDLTGKLSQIGRIWHRMYPHYITNKSGKLEATNQYVELLVIFPDRSQRTDNFLQFLHNTAQSKFKQVW